MPTVYKLPGGAIQANTITTSQLQTTVVTQIQAGGGPKVKSLIYPGNDTAANTVGGQTLYITGSGFAANAQVLVNGAAVPSQSFISASNISFTTPALSTGTYPVYLINPEDGGTAILYPGLLISGEPTWVTSAGSLSGSQDENSSWNFSLSTTGDTPITYALAAGNTLPSGITLAANGLISGTISSPTGNVTTYTFSVVATDAQNQDSTRQFSVTTSTGEGALFANNVLLIHADGTNNQNNHTFLDSSNNNFTITRNGNPTQGSFSPFSQTGWSYYFDGTGDYLTFPSDAAFGFGTGDITIECWFYHTSRSTGAHLFSNANDTLNLYINTSGVFGVYDGSVRNSSQTVPLNSWNHFAYVRSSGTAKLYYNGTEVLSFSSSTNYGTSAARIGVNYGGGSGSDYATGFISNLRVLKGTALYTTTFTPSTAALTAIANTQLLTCQSNRIRDASNNNFTITRNGDVSVEAFSPFAPTAAYSTANMGGSTYFDGVDDYIRANIGTTHSYWNNNFSIEFWVKYTGTALKTLVSSWNDIGFGSGSYFFATQNGNIELYHYQSSGTNQGAFISSSGASINDNSWHHIVVTQTTGGNKTFRIFIDGVLRGYDTETNWNQSTSNTHIHIGAQGPDTFGESSRFWVGHFSGFRLIANSILDTYVTSSTTLGTSVFSVPTSPPTNVANTYMLLNFTNAGIFDQTAKNILETVGGAVVSTSQYKYGTGSISVSSGNYLSMRSSSLLDFGAGDFTVECWVRPTSITQDTFFISATGAGGFIFGVGPTSSTIGYGRAGVAWDYSAAHGMTTGNWYHVAVTRSGTSIRMFVDGAQIGSTQTSSQAYNLGLTSTTIGSQGANYYFTGHIDDLRVTKGYARYTSNFTAPTSAFKDK